MCHHRAACWETHAVPDPSGPAVPETGSRRPFRDAGHRLALPAVPCDIAWGPFAFEILRGVRPQAEGGSAPRLPDKPLPPQSVFSGTLRKRLPSLSAGGSSPARMLT